MKRETFKTIILTILIAISLVFTWNIWMFQPVMQDQANLRHKGRGNEEDFKRRA